MVLIFNNEHSLQDTLIFNNEHSLQDSHHNHTTGTWHWPESRKQIILVLIYNLYDKSYIQIKNVKYKSN